MQICPKCGYCKGVDWPVILWAGAFWMLYVMFIVSVPRNYRLMGSAPFFLFLAGTIWGSLRNTKDRSEYLKLNPSVTERVKAHIRPTPSQ
jgi:hypothetical protein